MEINLIEMEYKEILCGDFAILDLKPISNITILLKYNDAKR